MGLVGSGVTFGIVLLVAYFVVYLGPLSFRPLHLPDETRYAEIPREMLATGDWIVPRLNGLRYFEKPVFGYWVTALSILCFGENRFAVRLPCALATGLSAMLLVLILRCSGHATSALTGAVVFLTSLEVYTLGVFNTPDALFTVFITASMVCFHLALHSGGAQTKIVWLCAAGVACGLGFLTKGLLSFAIPTVAICPFLLWQKRWKDLFTLPWIPLFVTLAIVLPWAIMIHLREPDYWRHFIFVEHFKRFASTGVNSFHHQPFWILVPYLIGGAVPWTFSAFAAIKGFGKTGWGDPLIRYALCWLLFPFLLLSVSKGKLGTYILPCFVPLSLLLAAGLTQGMNKQDSGPFRIAAWTSAAVAGLAGAVITAMSFLNLTTFLVFASGERWKWIVGSAALVAWCGISIASARTNRKATRLGLFAAAPLALMLSAHFIVPNQAVESRTPEAFIERCAGAIDPEDQVYSTNYLAPATCWVLKRSDIGIVQRGGELQNGLNYPDAKNRQIQISELAKQIDERTRTIGIILMITDNDYSTYRKYLPKATWMEGTEGFVFLKYVGSLETSRKL